MSAGAGKYGRNFVSSIRKKIPKKTGVYLFLDQNGDVMYIGKSVNLRQRVSSYFRSNTAKIDYRVREMVFHIGDIEYYETQTELLALLLEDALIKRYQPRYNVRQQQYLGYQYILLTEGMYPTCRMISHLEDPGPGQIFGPFKSKFFVEDLLWIIRRHLDLRSCEEIEPMGFSLSYEFGYCTGPCRGKISPEVYSHIVRRVIGFLNGDDKYVTGRLTMAMEKASEALQFEKAEELKERIEFCLRFCERQRFLHRFKEQKLTIQENGDLEVIYKFEKGRFKNVKAPCAIHHDIASFLRHEPEDSDQAPRFLLDRANIVYSWIHNEKNDCEYVFR